MLDQDNSFHLMSLSILMTCLLDNILIYSERSYSLINPESQWFNNPPIPERSVRLPGSLPEAVQLQGESLFHPFLAYFYSYKKSRSPYCSNSDLECAERFLVPNLLL